LQFFTKLLASRITPKRFMSNTDCVWNLDHYMPTYTHTAIPVISEKQFEALIVLNYELPSNLEHLWHRSELRICADGGTTRLRAHNHKLLPNVILGDFDSVSPEDLNYYTSCGVSIISSPDQDTTDLQKCMLFIEKEEEKRKTTFNTVMILGGLGGCLSHVFANINVLYQYKSRRLILIGQENVGLLCPSQQITHIQVINLQKYKYCSVIPVGGVAHAVSSTGMKWNLDNATLEFGGLVSTSNEVVAERVSITTPHAPLLWLLDLKH